MNRPEIVQSCPEPELWIRYAAGICPPDQQESLLDHAAECVACANRLRDLINAVSGEQLDPGSEAGIEALSDRLDAKRRTLARKMSGAHRPVRSDRHWMLSIAAGLAILVAAGGWLVFTRWQSDPPLQLLATAYTSRRTMELRIPGAGYSPLQVARSSTSLTDIPPALLESQLRIERHLESKPEDATWLHAQGRAQLLLWQFDPAIRSFQAAADLGADSPDFLIDYASAYYQRAERNAAALDYALALEKLGQALKQRPDDPAALFNSGIVHAKLHQYDSAIEDFEHCLRVQTDPKWKAETQARLDEVKRLKTAVFDPNRAPTGEFRAESDLERAMSSDLTRLFHGSSSAVEEISAAMIDQHQDPWLHDVIRLPHTPETVRAVESLSELTRLRINYNTADNSGADEIEWLHSTSLPSPLRIWRDYELLYRDARSSAVAHCAPETQPLIADGARYPWFEAQILLDSSVCRAAIQDFTGAGLLVDRAERLVNEKRFLLTSIRIPNFRGQRLAETGYFREAAQAASDALARMEAGSYPARRAYDFYGILMLVASQLNLPNTGYGASRMMATVGESCGIRFFEMVGQCRRAGFALSLGRESDAGVALQNAASALASLGYDATSKIYWRTSQIAWLESRGDRDTLYRMLEEAHREGPAKKENLYFNRKLISALCRLESQARRRSEVERMATQFWNDASGAGGTLSPGALRAFRPELESVSQSLVRVRLESGDESGALEAWERFLQFDQRLLGGRSEGSSPDRRAGAAAILTIADLGEKVAVWFEQGGRIQFHWALESYPELERRVHELRRLCSLGVSVDAVSLKARALYHILFPAEIATPQVYIRARRVFETMPLATFSLTDEGSRTTFSFLPFGEQPRPAMTIPADHARMTVVTATKVDPSLTLAPLPDDEIAAEVAAAREAFAGATVIRGADATPRVMEQAAQNSQALHFAGHAVQWRGSIGLLLSPDPADKTADGRAGFWSMSRPRSVNADLVVLSACNTGAFEDQATVEPGQLALSMLLAGARQVVASLWDVDSSATTAWNGAFYRDIAHGEPPESAMKHASEQVRTTARWRSPKYWAGFALYQQ